VSKRALGRGIDALFQAEKTRVPAAPGKKSEAGASGNSYVFIDIERVRPNPDQPRKEFREEALRELADSIRANGVIQPIIVEALADGAFMVVAGERRLRAARMVGLKQVPVVTRSFSAEEKVEIALIENIQREDLTPIEEARAYRGLIDSSGLNQEDLAAKIGKNRSTVANALRLLKLPDDMQQALGSRELTPGHARAILSVVNPADQRILFNRCMARGLSVREAEALAASFNKGGRSAAGKKKDDKPARNRRAG
jgi:ParB family chromosome partitioning protein